MTDLEAPDFAALSVPQQVGWGARYAVRGARILAAHPRLWGYVFAPIALMIGAFALGAGLILWLVPLATGLLWVPGPESAPLTVTMYAVALWTVRIVLVGALLLALYLTAGLVATPFNDRLSEQIERRILRTTTDEVLFRQFVRDLFWSVAHSALSLAVYLAVMGVLLLLNLLPGVGSAVSFVVGALVSAMFFTRESMDGSLSRRRMGYVAKWRTVAGIWPYALGFGGVVSLAMWLPLLNFLVLPMSVAGGTALFCHLERAGALARGVRDPLPGGARVGSDDPAHG